MLTKITLENFKVFRHATEFPLAKINLLTGINGRGKSSLLQSLLLMRQSIEYDENAFELILNGSYVHLGTWEDVKNKDNRNEDDVTLSFCINSTLNNKRELKYFLSNQNNQKLLINKINYSYDNKLLLYKNSKDHFLASNENKTSSILLCYLMIPQADFLSFYAAIPQNELLHKDNEFTPNDIGDRTFLTIHYIAADRIGAKNFYEKDLHLNNDFITIEKTGKNVLDVISYYKNLEIDDSLSVGTDKDLIAQIGKWLGYILDATVSINLDDSNKFVNSFTYTINGKENLLPTNVGFGYSYILPIVTAGLIAKAGEILIVENPEAHLHPKAQSRLTEFLAKVATTGVQVFVESHSEHILNGLRIATITNDKQNKILEKEDVSILYFDNSETYFKQIKILEDNDLSVWAEDFFDQTNKDYKTIYGY